jgi:hypothetical protein
MTTYTDRQKACPHCHGTGWVCEIHPDKPWEGNGACGCGGAGASCSCNPDGSYEFEATYASTDPETIKTWVQ